MGTQARPIASGWVLLVFGLGLSVPGSPAWAEPLTVNLLIDRKENKAFLEEVEYWFTPGYVYDIQ